MDRAIEALTPTIPSRPIMRIVDATINSTSVTPRRARSRRAEVERLRVLFMGTFP
jgi:hypothetical protein